MNANGYTGGWFLITTDGGDSIAVLIDHQGELAGMIEPCNYATHLAANDRYATIVTAIENEETNEYATVEVQYAK